MRFDKNQNKKPKTTNVSRRVFFRSNDHLVFEGDGEYPPLSILVPKPPTAMQFYLHFS